MSWVPYVGQKVVALDNGRAIIKGNTYTIAEVICCSRCGRTGILLTERTPEPTCTPFYSCACGCDIITKTEHTGGDISHYRPLEEFDNEAGLEQVEKSSQPFEHPVFSKKQLESSTK